MIPSLICVHLFVSLAMEGRLTGTDGEGEGEGRAETVMLPGGVPLEMVYVEPGTFMMGRYLGEQDSYDREDPQHEVTLTQGFWLGKYALTKAQWTAVMSTTPWAGKSFVGDYSASPATHVSWNDAQAFIAALNMRTAKAFRLPTEAEWEYACRAGTTTRFYWGDDPGNTVGNDHAWWYYNTHAVGESYAHVVGRKLPNDWGLYDMNGNVWEWCADWYASSYASGAVTDPAGPTSGSNRVIRGGSWLGYGYHCRSARRSDDYPSYAGDDLGFRLAR
jgi:formylglycine-generating enzyme required for sulfatase activity